VPDPLHKAQSVHTAHISNNNFGNLTITHPYHPLNGKSFDILKIKQINGARRYSLHVDNDILCVPESWTDRCAIQSNQVELGTAIFDMRHLTELVELLRSIKFISENSVIYIDKLND
jgi:hypothetical protein